jgi:UDP-2-acetamido-2,6-beta-L-arabino-hexul-4-ose reductase
MSEAIAVTGARGFLGWHVRVLARALGLPDPVVVDRAELADPSRLASILDGADRVLHLAGANRGTDDDVIAGNVGPAQALANALRRCVTPPKTVAFANSIQVGNGTPYGESKQTAAGLLADAARWTGSTFEDVRLPNIFGEHGRPHYNSVIATFCRLLAEGGEPEVRDDRELTLVHVTDAAAQLIDAPPAGIWDATMPALRIGVRTLAERLSGFAATYRTGQIPPLTDRHDVRLFNTYRSHCFPLHYPMPLTRHADQRGDLVEVVKAHGGAGQTFCSTSYPGITRGEHIHLGKVVRFVVLRGTAEIRLRRIGDDRVVRFSVGGHEPVVVDMPTMWAHSITNTGPEELLTLFWTNELFDPARPDTYPEPVCALAVPVGAG